jgi:PAS domain S-box-containing protein
VRTWLSTATDPNLPTLRGVFDALADGVIMADDEGHVTYLNPAAARLHGVADVAVPLAEWSTRYHLFTLDERPYPPEELPLARAALGGETVADAVWRIRRADGSEIVAEGTASPLAGADGSRAGAILVLRDVTARESLRSALLTSEAEFRALNTASPAGTFRADLTGNVTFVNPKLESIWGGRQRPSSAGGGSTPCTPTTRRRSSGLGRGERRRARVRARVPDRARRRRRPRARRPFGGDPRPHRAPGGHRGHRGRHHRGA